MSPGRRHSFDGPVRPGSSRVQVIEMNNESLATYLSGRLFRQVILAIFLGVLLLSALSVFLTMRGFAQLGVDIDQTLVNGRQKVDGIMDANRTQLTESIHKVEQNAAASLSQYLNKSLKAEMGVMQTTIHSSLTEGAKTLTVLLAGISQEPILGRNYAQLVNYVKTVSSQDSVLYAVYYKPDGTPYTRYVNRKDPKVKALMDKGSGRTPLDKLLSAVPGDPSVTPVSQEIRFEGRLLGRIELGVSTAAADAALAAASSRVDQLIVNSGSQVKQILDQEGARLSGKIEQNFAGIKAENEHSAAVTTDTIHQSASRLEWWQLVMSGGAGLVILVSLCWFLLARVIAPIHGLTHSMEDIASGDGDLTRRLPQNERDEIGRLGGAFNHFVEKIQDVISRAVGSTERLSRAADQLARVASENNAGVSAQLGETEQVATAINEMAATVREVAHSAESAAAATREASNDAAVGKQVVTETVRVINTLAEEVEQASGVINRLEDDSVAIGTVLDVIRSIADQTNLLALNAAIEAARAGEQGRGFAVVAEEVRSLASRTQSSTAEIQDMIQRLQTGTREAVQVMNTGVSTTRDTVEKAAGAGLALDNIVARVATINDMSNQIASAAEEQTVVAAEIDRSVVHISDLGTNATQATRQIAQASQDLAQLSGELRQMVCQFKV